jgi:hypothetical protein
MANYLRRNNTATQYVLVGPIVSATDGITTINSGGAPNSAIFLWKHGGTSLVSRTTVTSDGVHAGSGYYYIGLGSGDTDTAGILEVIVAQTGQLPARRALTVLQQNAYDGLFTTNVKLQVDMTQISGDTGRCTNLGMAAKTMSRGTVYVDGTYTASTTVFHATGITFPATDHLKGRILTFTNDGGNLENCSTVIEGYEFVDSTYAQFTVTALPATPANNATFVIT